MKILKFYTQSCSQCKQQSKILESLDLEIAEIDCDENEKLVSKYSIRSVPTLVILDSENNVVKKFIGLTTIDKIKEIL